MRLFMALELPRDVRDRVTRRAAPLRSASPALAWVSAERLHVTLRFLGDCAEALVTPLADLLRNVTARHAALRVEIGGIGAFPDWHRPRVVWVGVRDAGRLAALARELDAGCATLGLPRERRPFHPHVTLARTRRPLAGRDARSLEAATRLAHESWSGDLDAVTLVQSELTPGGSRYRVLCAAPLSPR